MKIYLVRHGETDSNKRKIIQGSGIDGSLNDNGRLQAQQFFNHYKNVKFDAIYTSSLLRTQETMTPFLIKGQPIYQNEDINEIKWGIHEGKRSNSTLIKRYKSLLENWSRGEFDERIEGGDSFSDLKTRVLRFLDNLYTKDYVNVLICTHGRTLRCMLTLLTKEHPREMEKYLIHNTGLYILKVENDRAEILLRNNVSHIR